MIRCCGDTDEVQLDGIVRDVVQRVGHSYGRWTMHVLQSEGIRVSQTRVGNSLRLVTPVQHSLQRHQTNQLLNPLPYRARYCGEKLHLDQNEKCVMFSVTHVVASYSRKIVGFITITKKNHICVYDLPFRPLLHSQGL